MMVDVSDEFLFLLIAFSEILFIGSGGEPKIIVRQKKQFVQLIKNFICA
jgi:hypothetical protein